MTALLETVLAQAAQISELEQDAVAARLLQTLTEYKQEKQTKAKPRPQFGSAKGMFTVAPDFDDPLTDFEKPAPSMTNAAMTELLRTTLDEVVRLPAPEQNILAGLILTELIRKAWRKSSQDYNAKLWARLRRENPEYVRDYDAGQRRKAERAAYFIGLVLLVDWDPIGVFGIPATEREYAGYVSGVHQLLLSYPPAEAVADHLHTIEQEQMGLGGKGAAGQAARRAVLMQVAQKLVSLSSEWRLEAAETGSGV